MSHSGKDAALGFFAVEMAEGVGLTGGYLLLNLSGRPLEFHCTLPVRPTRAHEILYGPTLLPHVIGERIGPALLDRSRITPLLLCVDTPAAAPLRAHIAMPLVLIQTSGEGGRQEIAGASPAIEHFRVLGDVPGEADAVPAALARLTEPIDLAEPFQRIREALREAHQAAARAAA